SRPSDGLTPPLFRGKITLQERLTVSHFHGGPNGTGACRDCRFPGARTSRNKANARAGAATIAGARACQSHFAQLGRGSAGAHDGGGGVAPWLGPGGRGRAGGG